MAAWHTDPASTRWPNESGLLSSTFSNRPTERRRGGLRRAGVAGSAGWPSLNARLSPESPLSRPHVLRQALPAVPARRRLLVVSPALAGLRHRRQRPGQPPPPGPPPRVVPPCVHHSAC